MCGDGYAIYEQPGSTLVLVVDGLGHGELASQSALAAIEAFGDANREGPADIITHLHGALRATRGAAAAVALFDHRSREIRFSGIGNIAGVVFSGTEARHMTSLPGIVGHDSRRVREFTYAWPLHATALLYSDGIATHWSIHRYEGLLLRDPVLVAGVLYRDWNRGRDDATILALREQDAP